MLRACLLALALRATWLLDLEPRSQRPVKLVRADPRERGDDLRGGPSPPPRLDQRAQRRERLLAPGPMGLPGPDDKYDLHAWRVLAVVRSQLRGGPPADFLVQLRELPADGCRARGVQRGEHLKRGGEPRRR